MYDGQIVIAGISKFTGNQHTALLSISSIVILSGMVHFVNNSAFRGGAISLYSSRLGVAPGADVRFINNSASREGGAIYVDPDLSRNVILWQISIDTSCFFSLLNCQSGANYSFYFTNNSAVSGGNDIYGASLESDCKSHH